ncbi:MAG: hypothetical protein K0U39_08915 [Alphaproteobacteria bacterium]|nr:hypothetical protein [Alphaproteobacteria bacterium]
MLLDDTIKRNLHLFTIMQKSHIDAVGKWARKPYGVISAHYHPKPDDLAMFDAICDGLCNDSVLKVFDCGQSKNPILQTIPHQLRIFIYQGRKSQQLQQFAEVENYCLLTKRPPALILSIDESKWQAQIEQWQETQAIRLIDYL